MAADDHEPKPIYVRHEPCKRWDANPDSDINPFVNDDGRCAQCDQKVPHDRLGPKRPNVYTRVAHDHDRPVEAHVVEDMVSCSCGGWHGTPVGRDRVDSGAELLLLSFQGKVDDIEHNQANAVDLLCEVSEKLDTVIALLRSAAH